ncbi:MAG: hypothetical protein HY329_20730 [Chloroflexi bacterium]|nr:hypothetical protein [Chloroflexota bacterium]
MADAAKLLRRIGFGEYEARVYVALVQHGPMNGYGVAKVARLPRANVYAVLQKLEERGAIVRLETQSGRHYAPVPPAELIHRLGSGLQRTLQAAQHSLEALARPTEPTYVWDTREYSVVLDHARSLVDGSQGNLMVAIRPPEARSLADNVAQAEARAVSITTLCLEGCPEECGGCRGRVYRSHRTQDANARWLVMVRDSADMLAAEVGQDGSAQAVRTNQRLLVELAASYVLQSITVATVIDDLGERLEQLLGAEAQSDLNSLPRGADTGWLDRLRRLLARPKS